MRQRTRNLIAVGAVSALAVGGGVAVISSAGAATIPNAALGLSSNGKNLTTFDLKTAKRIKGLGAVKGLSGDTKLVGIDQRPQDHRFYGVGNKGGVYRINSGNGTAYKMSQLTVELSGTSFGVDFNPAADRLRVISNTGQNLRHDVSNTVPNTANDGALNYPTGTPPTAGAPAQGLTAAAYTNNDVDPRSGTTLFDLDTNLDQVVQQVPANSGTLVVSGPFGPRQGPIAGFDIVSTHNSASRTVENTGYASIRPTGGGLATLYTVDLLSGKFTKVAKFNKDIADIAIPQP